MFCSVRLKQPFSSNKWLSQLVFQLSVLCAVRREKIRNHYAAATPYYLIKESLMIGFKTTGDERTRRKDKREQNLSGQVWIVMFSIRYVTWLVDTKCILKKNCQFDLWRWPLVEEVLLCQILTWVINFTRDRTQFTIALITCKSLGMRCRRQVTELSLQSSSNLPGRAP